MQYSGMTIASLARAMGISYQAVKKVLVGDSASFNAQNNANAAAALKVHSDWLSQGLGDMRLPAPRVEEPHPEYAGTMNGRVQRVIIVGTARLSEGEDGFYDEMSSVPGAGDGHIDIATADPNAYGLRVRGNSMSPAIRDGWYVLIEPNAAPAVGEYVLVKLKNGRKMVKELLFQRSGSIEIMSVNGERRQTVYQDELESLQAVAAVVSPSKWKPD
jgi:phage repressor protein C with HTH and peptisase S24 domain